MLQTVNRPKGKLERIGIETRAQGDHSEAVRSGQMLTGKSCMTLMVTSSAIHRMGLSDLFFFMIQLS
jgi:hypothetical protein